MIGWRGPAYPIVLSVVALMVGGLYVRDQFEYPGISAVTRSQQQQPNADLTD